MALLFASTIDPPGPWLGAFAAEMPELEVRVWPDCGDPADIEFALVWGTPAGEMGRFPNLKVLFSLGAGVDHLLAAAGLPQDVPLVRLVDPGLRTGMVEYVVMRVLHHHRRMPDYEAQQRRHRWRMLAQRTAAERGVGIMGLGVLGGACAEALARFGFAVAGWARRPRERPAIACFHGAAGLAPFLARSEILVCLLPLTAETRGILDARLFAALPAGAAVINVARGAHLVEADLLAALESGRLAGATLDVFRDEPLPPDHPFWGHPKITVTPHIAALTMPATAVRAVAENIRRFRAGRPLKDVVDRERGY